MDMEKMEETARAIVAKGKGILAADESLPTIKKRFDAINVESTEENRNAYRELLFTTKGMERYISGVILFDETLRSKSKDGQPFPELLREKGVFPGIKVDKGVAVLPGTKGEKVSQGLDGLKERMDEYYKLGARFAKFRSVITIGHGIPTPLCIDANAHVLARYAAISQSAGLVPVVEPEVLMNGDHAIDRCYKVTFDTLARVFYELHRQGVAMEQMLLKPNMVISGLECPEQADVQTVAEMTIRCFKRVVPPALPGVVFLSGGQTPAVATEHLNAMNKPGENPPWEISFSYGRALQEPPLKTWKGDPANKEAAQKAFLHRAKCNGLARSGEYASDMESRG